MSHITNMNDEPLVVVESKPHVEVEGVHVTKVKKGKRLLKRVKKSDLIKIDAILNRPKFGGR